MNTNNRKTLILSALRAFINQRSGIEFGNYGDVKAFRAEQRGIQKDRRQALELLRAVELSSEIGADELIAAARSAYSGRLTITDPKVRVDELRAKLARTGDEHVQRILRASINSEAAAPVRIDYCTGQYFPTEYRRAACAVLASALWEYVRAHCMPPVNGYGLRQWGDNVRFYGVYGTQSAAKVALAEKGGDSWGHIVETYGESESAGDWLRAHFLRQFGRDIASRWFS